MRKDFYFDGFSRKEKEKKNMSEESCTPSHPSHPSYFSLSLSIPFPPFRPAAKNTHLRYYNSWFSVCF